MDTLEKMGEWLTGSYHFSEYTENVNCGSGRHQIDFSILGTCYLFVFGEIIFLT